MKRYFHFKNICGGINRRFHGKLYIFKEAKMNFKALVFVSLVLLALSGSACAATKLWIGPAAGTWSTAGNWSPSGMPGSGDDVLFDPSTPGGSNTDSVMDYTLNGSFNSVTLQSGYTGTTTIGGTNVLDFLGNANASGLSIAGGTFDIGNGEFDGPAKISGGLLKVRGSSSGKNSFFENLQISGGTFDAQNATLTSINQITQSGGVVNAGPGNVFVVGNWSHTGGTFNPGTGTVVLTNNSAYSIDSGGAHFNNLQIVCGFDGKLINNDLQVNGTFMMSNPGESAGAQFLTNGKNVTVGQLTTIIGGSFRASSGTHNLNGGLTVSGNSFVSGTSMPTNGTFDGQSATVNITGDVTLQGSNSNTQGIGILTGGSATFNVSGNWSVTSNTSEAAFNYNTCTVNFNGNSTTQTLNPGGGANFYNVTHSGTGTLEVSDVLTINGALTQTAGIFTMQNGVPGVQVIGLTTLSQPAGGTSTLDVSGSNGVMYLSGGVNMSGGLLKGGGPANLQLQSGLTATVSPSGAQPSITGALLINSGTQTFTINGAPTQLTVNAPITGSGQSLTMAGTGTMIFQQNNSYTGTTTVNAGTLLANGNETSSAYVVNNGATLGGNGTVGPLTVNAGGIVNPGGGALSTGTLTVAGNALFNGGILDEVVNSTLSGAFDQLAVTGTVTLMSPNITGTAAMFTAPIGTQIKILDNQSAGAISGTFAGQPEGSTVSLGGRLFSISYVGGTGNDVVLTTLNAPPAFASAPSAAPNPAGMGQTVQFTSAPTDPDGGETLTVTWAFGDGTNGIGAMTSHAYMAPGTYNATATVSDGSLTASAMLSVTVNAPLVGFGLDSDGDGFSDNFESAAGSDSFNAASTPLSGAPATAGIIQPLTISSASIKLNFGKTGNDSITFSGTLAVPAGFSANGQKVAFDVRGVDNALTLTTKGNAVSGEDSVKIAIKSTKGKVLAQTSKYSVTFKNGSFAAMLAAAGLTNADAKGTPVMVPFTFLFNNTIYQKTQSMSYTAKKGKSGAAK